MITQSIYGTELVDTSNAGGLLVSTTDGDIAPSTTTLATDIGDTDTTFTLASGAGVVDGASIQIGSEVVSVVGHSGATVTVTRSSGVLHSSGAVVNLPGLRVFQVLPIAAAPNSTLIVSKITTDINCVQVTAAYGHTFPNGGSSILLTDADANSTVQLKFPGSGTQYLLLAAGGNKVDRKSVV